MGRILQKLNKENYYLFKILKKDPITSSNFVEQDRPL